MHNLEIRAAIRRAGFFGYEVAAALGVSESYFSRLLSRSEISAEKKENILHAIEKMSIDRELAQ